MGRTKSPVPTMRCHVSGFAVVTICGRDIYLGKHNSVEALARYAALISLYQKNDLSLPEDFDPASLNDTVKLLTNSVAIEPKPQAAPVSVRIVTAAYREVVKVKYASQKAERLRCIQVCDDLDEHDGNSLALFYGPVALAEQRKRWVEKKYARVYCNRLTNVVFRMFKNAVAAELIGVDVWHKLLSLEPLREGQTTAHETEPVMPVELSHVAATAKQLSPVVRDMVRIHVRTAMRPNELCTLRPCEVDRSQEEWMYRPLHHKNRTKGKTRAIPIVEDARKALEKYLDRPPEDYCFSPTEAMQQINALKRSERKSKVQPSQISRAKKRPKTRPGLKYTPDSYRKAIQRACKRAGVPSWFPYQLRHLSLTEVRWELDGEAAQALAGHSRMDTTERYARQKEAKAILAAKAAPSLNLD